MNRATFLTSIYPAAKAVGPVKDSVALIISSHQPTPEASRLLRVAIESSLSQEGVDFEVWVVDVGSPPAKHVVSSETYPEVKFLIRPTIPRTWRSQHVPGKGPRKVLSYFASPHRLGSYSNGWGLQWGIHEAVIHRLKAPKYFMTLQMDVMFTSATALRYMMEKFDGDTAAVGVRLQPSYGGSEKILHSLGCLWKSSAFLALNTTMLPDFPMFDVGENAISRALGSGFNIKSLENTYSNATLVEKLEDRRYQNMQADRSIDEEGRVVFMHLGRGIPLSTMKGQAGAPRIDQWVKIWESLSSSL